MGARLRRQEGRGQRRFAWSPGLALALSLLAATSTSGQNPKPTPAPAPATAGRIASATLKKVKQATVHLKVTLPNGQKAEGSGFFGIEPGIILTNAHVLGMFKADSRRPLKVETVIGSGAKGERTLTAKVLGVDTGSDLALLRVEGADLPTPLEVGPADGLEETQVVYIFGFPFGSMLGKAITVNTASVSSLRRNDAGTLQRVQVHGGMDPGNSGGPVVDTDGKVVGVAVAIITQSQVSFAVPGEAVAAMVAGRVKDMTFGHPFKSGAETKSLVELKLVDPLKKIQKVSLAVWSGKSAKLRTEAPPQPPTGDPKRRELKDLPVKDGVASAEMNLPVLAEGDVYWAQPYYNDGAGKAQRWLPVLFAARVPVERTPVVLKLNHTPNSKNDLEMTCVTTYTLRDASGEEHTLSALLKANMLESIAAVDGRGIAGVHVTYTKISLGTKIDNQSLPRDRRLQATLPNLFRVKADLRVDSKGAIVENHLDLAAVPRNARELVEGIAAKIQKSFEAVELSLPGELTQPNVAWTGRRDLPIETVGDDELGIVDARYTYIGRHKRNGIDEAIVEIKGDVKGNKGNGLNLGGRVQGLALVNLDTNQVIQANVTTYLDLDLTLNGRPGKANGKLEVRLSRKPSAAPAAPLTKPKADEAAKTEAD